MIDLNQTFLVLYQHFLFKIHDRPVTTTVFLIYKSTLCFFTMIYLLYSLIQQHSRNSSIMNGRT